MTVDGVLMLVLILIALIGLNLCLMCRLLMVRMFQKITVDRPIRPKRRNRGCKGDFP